MTSLSEVTGAIGKVVSFLKPVIPLVRCHMVDYFTLSHWDTLLPPRIQEDLINLPRSHLLALPSASIPHDEDESSEECDWSSCGLPSFLAHVRNMSPAGLGVTSDIEKVLLEYGSDEISVLSMKGIMSNKKTHEVEVMSQVIARLSKGLNVSWLVDLGSGRGYLSSSLVLQYGQKVVAIDSSNSNTSSALERNNKMKRMWDNLRKRRQEEEKDEQPARKGKPRRRRRAVPLHQLEGTAGVDCRSHPRTCFYGVTKFITEDTDLLELVRDAVMDERCEGDEDAGRVDELPDEGERLNAHTNAQTLDAYIQKTHIKKGEEVGLVSEACVSPTNTHTHTNTILPTIAQDNTHSHNQHADTHSQTHTPKHNTKTEIHTDQESHTSPTHTNTHPRTHTEENRDSIVKEASHLGLIGLHTCGNLASSSLKLFTTNTRVKFICNVGCCYHLLEEEFSRNTYNQRKEEIRDYVDDNKLVSKEEGELVKNDKIEPHNPSDNQIKTKEIRESVDIKSEFALKEDGGVVSKQENSATNTQLRTVNVKDLKENMCLSPGVKTTTALSETMKDDRKTCVCLSSAKTNTPYTNTRSKTGIETEESDPIEPSLIPNHSHGFPMSSYLRQRRFAIGRNARMLSCQAVDRLTQGTIGGSEGLYWRALLQVVLKDKLEDVSDLPHVGRLSAKCQTFTQYTRAAVAKLGVSLDVTDEELEEYDRRYRCDSDKLERFFLLRASLAAVVEGLMLLDRLAFLLEQKDVSPYLVPLFDPVTSPRCHALIAIRHTYTDTHAH